MAKVSNGANSRQRIRRAPRVNGPFDARRIGEFTLGLSIHDLSITGCLIESFHEVASGSRMTLEIDLPEGTITVTAESVYARPDFGFAVRFVDMSPQARVALAHTVLHRLTQGKSPR